MLDFGQKLVSKGFNIRFHKWPLRPLGLGLFGALFYVGATFLFLSTPIFESVVVLGEQQGKLEVGRGWSWIPGIVHLRDVRLEIEDPNIHLRVQLPSARARINLASLLRRQVQISELLTPVDAPVRSQLHLRTPKENADYLTQEAARKAKESPADPNDIPWLVHIQGVTLPAVNGMSIDEWKFDGQAEIQGGFKLLPGREAEIYPCTLRILRGTISGLTARTEGQMTVEFKKFSVPDVKGNEVFKYFYSQFALKADVTQLHFLNPLFQSAKVKFGHEGAAQLETHGEIRAGKVQTGTEFRFAGDPLSLRTRDFKISARGTVEANVLGDKNREEALFRTHLSRIRFSRPRDNAILARGKSLTGTIRSRDLNMQGLFENIYFTLTLDDVLVPSLARWVPSIPFEAKSTLNATFHGWSGFTTPTRQNAGKLSAKLEAIRFRNKVVDVAGSNSVHFTAVVPPFSLDERILDLNQADARGKNFNFKYPKSSPTEIAIADWGFDLKGKALRWRLPDERHSESHLRGKIGISLKNTAPITRTLNEMGELGSFWIKLIPDLPLRIQTEVTLNNAVWSFNPLTLRWGDLAHAQGELLYSARSAHNIQGFLEVTTGILAWGLQLKNDHFDTDFLPGSEFKEKESRRLHLEKARLDFYPKILGINTLIAR